MPGSRRSYGHTGLWRYDHTCRLRARAEHMTKRACVVCRLGCDLCVCVSLCVCVWRRWAAEMGGGGRLLRGRGGGKLGLAGGPPRALLSVPAVRAVGPAAAQAYFLAFPALPAAVVS